MRFTNKFPYTNINNINLDWIIKRVKELGETVLGYAADIANAVALAEAAQEAADSVTGTAESAVTTAQAAEATANAIAGTANTALATAQAAETTAQAAETTANAIAGTANTALATAQAAETTAQAAETTAQAAEERAENAETLAGTASANASNAGQTANTALATAQAAEATAEAAEATADNAETIAGAASANASNAIQTANTALATAQAAEAALNEKAGALITTESGAVVSFVPDRTIEQNLSVSVSVVPNQPGSGAPSINNVRQLAGWDNVNIMHSGADTSNPTTVNIPLGDTIYGGTLDVTAGTLAVEYLYKELTSNLDIVLYSYIGQHGIAVSNFMEQPGNRNAGYCSHSEVIAGVGRSPIWYGVNNNWFFWLDILDKLNISTVDEFKAWLDTQHVQCVYKINTPIIIQLSPVQIAAIIGQINNVWADAGAVSVEFAADLKWYIDSKIAEVQALTLENGG